MNLPTLPSPSRCAVAALLALAGLIALPGAAPLRAADKPSPSAVAFFEQRVRPVFAEHCIECHGPEKQESGLRLDDRTAALRGGDSGPAIVPGDPQASLLVTAVRYHDSDYEMPPDGKLADEQIAALVRWVKSGAAWPAPKHHAAAAALGDQDQIRRVAEEHWAFQPIARPELPAVNNSAWIRQPLDAFVLARLEGAGLQPSPAADGRTLLRRVSFDLTGLPPTPEEVEAFLNDDAPGSYARLVDRLLASPHYGERWGRHWLDVARYADTRDYVNLEDPRYPYAYTYRDYVIRALNADTPFDQFVREQLAADLYPHAPDDPRLAALGLLTVGPRFRGRTDEQISDRLDVVGRGLLGLTVACARCHDHKYDPIPTADYYSLYGVFDSCSEPEELPVIAVGRPPEEAIAAFERERAEKVKALVDYGEQLRREAIEALKERYAEHLDAWFQLNVARSASVRKLITGGRFKETVLTPLARNLDRVGTDRRWKDHPVLAPWARTIRLPNDKFSGQLQALLAAAEAGSGKQPQLDAAVLAALADPPTESKRELLRRYGRLFDRAAGAPKDKSLDAVRALLDADDSPFALSREGVVQGSRLLGKGRQKLAKLENAIRDVESNHPGAPARAMVLVDKPKPVTPAIFLRGDRTRRGERVPRRFLSILAGDDAPPFKSGSGRRELAEAITDPANPLTPRVVVNRIWMRHFGQALVETPGDFGLQTAPPTHPELLDYLASTFVEQGWSLKKLHRAICLSSTYRQQSASRPEGAKIDPENRLLWRANRRRLDFESLRDAILQASGHLDRTLGGRPVSLTEQPFTGRRTVYGLVNRLNLDDLFSTFDFPSPDQTAPQRAETTVPQQALFVMNDPFMVEQARRLAALPELQARSGLEEKTRYLYGRLFGRLPLPAEVAMAGRFLQDAGAAGDALPPPDWRYGYGPADRTGDASGAAVDSTDRDDGFAPLKHWTGKDYQASRELPDPRLGHVRLTASGGHPGRDLDHAAIRRWTAPRATTVAIHGTLTHLRDRGDGVRGRIVAGRGGVLGEWNVYNDKAETQVARYRVARGETIDFVVDGRRHPTSDAFTWAPVVRQVSEASGDSSGGKSAGKSTWDARADFAAPPPPPLTPWQQLCQALLLTNEFLFVD